MNASLLADAAERWGSPLYVTDLDAALERAAGWRRALPGALVAFAAVPIDLPTFRTTLTAEDSDGVQSN